MIGTERAACLLESEMLRESSVKKMKRATVLCGDPDIVMRPARDRRYCAAAGPGFRWFEWLAHVQQATLFTAAACARPQAPLAVRFHCVDEEVARFAGDLFCFAVLNQQQAAT